MSEVDALKGLIVQQLRVGYQIELRASDATWSSDVAIVIEGPFAITSADGTRSEVDPEDVASLTPALRLHQRTIEHASADQGTLRISFDDGTSLIAPPLDRYEAWQVSGPGTRLVVCTPGGELAVFPGSEAE